MISLFNIERFSLHNGEGIRTTIFLKGCSLRCPWCANPESWKISPEIMFTQNKFDETDKYIEQYQDKGFTVDNGIVKYDRAHGEMPMELADKSVSGAFEVVGKYMEIDEIVEEVMKDEHYYIKSNGGVTISGGEPFTQFDKMLELVKALKLKDLNVAVETCGQVTLDRLKLADPFIDSYLFDIKHLDAEKLKEVTGGSKRIIMEAFDYLAELDPNRLMVRVPVIPNFNFNNDDIIEIFEYCKQRKVKNIDLLPYHNLGKNKWEGIFKPYVIDADMLHKQDLEHYRVIGEEMGLNISIGGA